MVDVEDYRTAEVYSGRYNNCTKSPSRETSINRRSFKNVLLEMKQSDLFYQMLGIEKNGNEQPDVENKILQFQKSVGLVLPNDLKKFFSIAESSESQYNEKLYRFFLLKDFKGIDEELRHMNGIPDYSNIINTLAAYQECFVFADYMFHMFSYAIRLSDNESGKNEIYVICGEKYKVIANSFTEFVELYLSDSIKLQFED